MKKSLEKIKDIITRLRDLSSLAIANVTVSAIGGIFWFYMASLIGVESYGEVSYYIAISSMLGVVSTLGSGNTLIVYTAKGKKIQPQIFSISLISSIIISIIIFFIFYNVGVSLYIVGYVIFGLASSEILGLKFYRMYSKYLITQRILMVTLSVGLYYIIGFDGIILGIGLSFFPYCYRIYQAFRETKLDFSLIKPIRGFMVNSFFLDISRVFSGSADKLIIAPFFGFAILGNYQLGIQFLTLLLILPTVVYQYLLPQDASGIANKKLKKYTVIISCGLTVIGIFLAPIVVPFFFPQFTEAVEIIQIISLSMIPGSINLIYISKFLGMEKSKIVVIGSGIFIIVQVLGIFLLGQSFGANGIAMALVLAASSESVYLVSMNKFSKG